MLNASRYNVSAENDGELLLYNTATGAFASLEGAAARAWQDGTWGEELQGQLEEAGFVTALTPAEELAAQHAAFEEQRHEQGELTLALVPTYACNYCCPYCYEQGVTSTPGIMGTRVMDAVMDFIEARHADRPFAKLSVQWYGGDPSLALDVVEDLSEDMIEWCTEHGVAYDAMMLTNCKLIDADAADMLARCKVSSVLLTIDGFEETHNKRRVAADGSNSFKSVIGAADLFVERGMDVSAVMNVDKVNWHEYRELRDWVAAEHGVRLEPGRLSDCGHFYGTRDFKKPEFDLFTPEEYARLQCEELATEKPSASTVAALLAPTPRFCSGQRDDYFIIDCKGDVYACDGYVGQREHVRFSIFDEIEPEHLQQLSHNPFGSAECSACELLPLCMGNCDWERRTDQMQHHPLKYVLPEYLRMYRACFDAPTRGLTLLAAGRG